MAGKRDDNLRERYLRLDADGAVRSMPVGEGFWRRLAAGDFGSFNNAYMVSMQHNESDWGTWEMHPRGDEVLCLIHGRVTVVLEEPRGERCVDLCDPGDYVVVPGGTWHTARSATPSDLLLITAGEGTRHRPVTGRAAPEP